MIAHALIDSLIIFLPALLKKLAVRQPTAAPVRAP
jgi:hypothetical protein